MSEFRIPLEDGQVLVISYEIEEQVTVDDAIDAQSLGESLLSLLGRSPRRPVTARTTAVRLSRPAPRAKRSAPPPELSADEWLAQTSRDALRRLT